MADAKVFELADAVAATINAMETLPGGRIEVKSRNIHIWQLQDDEAMRISIIPRSDDGGTYESRNTKRYEYAVDLSVSRRVSGPDDPQFRVYALAAEQIADTFRFSRVSLAGGSGLEFRPTGAQPIVFDPDRLLDANLFMYLNKLTFAAWRS